MGRFFNRKSGSVLGERHRHFLSAHVIGAYPLAAGQFSDLEFVFFFLAFFLRFQHFAVI